MVFANVTYYYFASTRGAKCCDEHVRVSACLSASTSPEQHKISPNFYAIARLSSGGVLNLRYITSCFMDDVMLTHNGQEYATRKRSTDILKVTEQGAAQSCRQSLVMFYASWYQRKREHRFTVFATCSDVNSASKFSVFQFNYYLNFHISETRIYILM